jgi:hypothetical protein
MSTCILVAHLEANATSKTMIARTTMTAVIVITFCDFSGRASATLKLKGILCRQKISCSLVWFFLH